MPRVFIILLAVLLFNCQNSKNESPDTSISVKSEKIDAELEELFNLMQGSFNSKAQALADPDFYNISLHMYPIWEEKGYFLYVEQALDSMQDKPYRQRIYQIERADNSTLSSTIFTIPNSINWIGAWKNPAAFDSLSANDLMKRRGCAVLLKKLGPNHFKGATVEYSCLSKINGASYATSEVEITRDKIMSWDRGFDAEGHQVWGSMRGGYVFDKSVD
ncbi:MAG: chromophore lyase CpcT/CpeT [Bacteroidia bacterium]|nr:chromophore lyase CpcT/CpeT [Bacteroidia bacterium]